MKVVILAGGFGTRISEHTHLIPKPMINIGGRPIIWHIMENFAKQGFKDFVIALGYKSEIIKEYFLNYSSMKSDFTVNLSSGEVFLHKIDTPDWNVTLVDTGLHTMTGGRLKQLKDYLTSDSFILTYGDGLADVDIRKLVQFHEGHRKMATVTAVRPTARFGELTIVNDVVAAFEEKPQLQSGWINGGFFVLNREFLDLIESNETMLEREPLEKATSMGQLAAFKHEGFWQCMDSKRDHEALEKLWLDGAPWVVK